MLVKSFYIEEHSSVNNLDSNGLLFIELIILTISTKNFCYSGNNDFDARTSLCEIQWLKTIFWIYFIYLFICASVTKPFKLPDMDGAPSVKIHMQEYQVELRIDHCVALVWHTQPTQLRLVGWLVVGVKADCLTKVLGQWVEGNTWGSF